ncbi:MAG TPA: MBL fold metallo-hydrolase [Candidatus Krumholzibacteria bacterium]|nr:MBL fold metallo-hydrolase [Candidatus Krumholzibacteria bacterium]
MFQLVESIIASIDRPSGRRGALLACLALAAAAAAPARAHSAASRLAEGVHVIAHEPAPNGFPQGNTTVIIGEREVVVVDTGYWPPTARDDIALIRTWTDRPVRYLVNTHWHHDHCFANAAYVDSFPEIGIIVHEETRKDMDLFVPTSAPRLRDGIAALERRLASRKDDSGAALTAEDREGYRRAISGRQAVVREFEDTAYRPPTVTFSDAITLDIGEREVQIRFLGRGNTAGDAVVWLPEEKILVTGDLLVHPLPYCYDGYPAEWTATLRRLAALEAAIIVPGHGEVQRDDAYLRAVADLLASAVAQMNARLSKVGPAEFRAFEDVEGSVDLSSFRSRFAGEDADLGEQFDRTAALLVKLVFKEAALR